MSTKEKRTSDKGSNKEGIEFLVYTNTNNLRHILSMDEILCKSLFQTGYSQSFSNLIDWGIIVTHRPLANEFFSTFENCNLDNEGNKAQLNKDTIYQVALKVTLDDLADIKAILVDNQYNLEESLLKNYSKEKHISAVIKGFIPAFCIKAIFFRDENQKEEFSSTEMDNIYVDDSKLEVDDNLFNGDFKPDTDKLSELLKDKVDDDFLKKAKRRQRIRSSLFAALMDFKLTISDELGVYFDEVFMKFISKLLKKDNYNFNEDLKNMLEQLKGKLVEMPNANETPTDSTPFRYFYEDILEEKRPLNDNESIYDRNLFNSLINYFIDSNSFDLESGEFKEKLFREANIDDEKGKACIYEYLTKIKKTKSGAYSAKQLVEEIEKDPKKPLTLIALTALYGSSAPEDFNNLEGKFDSYRLDPFLSRLTLSMYGAVNYMWCFGREYKKNKGLLILTDLLAMKMLGEEYQKVIDKVIKKNELKNLHFEVVSSSENESNLLRGNIEYVESKLGLQLPVYISDVYEETRKKFLEKIESSPLFVGKLRKKIEEEINLPEARINLPNGYFSKEKTIEIHSTIKVKETCEGKTDTQSVSLESHCIEEKNSIDQESWNRIHELFENQDLFRKTFDKESLKRLNEIYATLVKEENNGSDS